MKGQRPGFMFKGWGPAAGPAAWPVVWTLPGPSGPAAWGCWGPAVLGPAENRLLDPAAWALPPGLSKSDPTPSARALARLERALPYQIALGPAAWALPPGPCRQGPALGPGPCQARACRLFGPCRPALPRVEPPGPSALWALPPGPCRLKRRELGRLGLAAWSGHHCCYFLSFLCFCGPLWAVQKRQKQSCKICHTKTALIERFRRSNPVFGDKSLFRLVRKPRRWFFFCRFSAVLKKFSKRPGLIVAIFWSFLPFCGPLRAVQKQQKQCYKICRAKTALIEIFPEVKPRFRHKPFLGLYAGFIVYVFCRFSGVPSVFGASGPHRRYFLAFFVLLWASMGRPKTRKKRL